MLSSSGKIIVNNKARDNATDCNFCGGNSYGSIVNIWGVGEISRTPNAHGPRASFQFKKRQAGYGMTMRRSLILVFLAGSVIFFPAKSYSENIDPCDNGSQCAYGENTGWINFEPNVGGPNVGATVTDCNLTGFIWGQNVGWINLGPNDDDPNTGVHNDGTGLLWGLAWGENVGWINFNPQPPGDANHYGVTIDHDGNFDGWAWGENIGWIHFQSASPRVPYKVQTSWITSCLVDFGDLGRFCEYWLDAGLDLLGDFDDSGDVGFLDYCTVADLWLELCPVGWPLH